MTQTKTYRVVRAACASDNVPASLESLVGAMRVGETLTGPDLYERLGCKISASSTKESAMAKVRKTFIMAQKIGLVVDVTVRPARPYADFKSLPSVSRSLAMLNTTNVMHEDNGLGGGTRHSYGYALYRFNNWLEGTMWSITTREANKDGSYREVRRDIEIRDVDHLLRLAMDRGGIDRDLSALIRRFFAEMNARRRHGRTVMVQVSCAIKSFFTSHEIPYGLQIPRTMMRGTGRGNKDDGWKDNTLKMSEFYRMLSVGKPTIRDKAILLAKFHRGLDLTTLADRFNYTAFEQMASHMSTDDAGSWDLDKCPVPIVLTRVKTDFKHLGFLEKDAVAANIEWIAERERLTGEALRRGDGKALYINQQGRPIRPKWIGDRFRALAIRAGLCTKAGSGRLSSTRHSHQLRHLLKSTLIDTGCRIDVADHVIGHSPKDTYERQATLYPDSIRREYAKAAAKINVFTNFEASIDGGEDIHRLRAEVESDRNKLKAVLEAASSGKNRIPGAEDDGSIPGPMAKMLAALQEDVRRLEEREAARVAAAAAVGDGGGGGATGEYQCIPCSLVHSSAACPACGSAERRMYGGGGGGK